MEEIKVFKNKVVKLKVQEHPPKEEAPGGTTIATKTTAKKAKDGRV